MKPRFNQHDVALWLIVGLMLFIFNFVGCKAYGQPVACNVTPQGQFHLEWQSQAGVWYDVWQSPDLVNWTWIYSAMSFQDDHLDLEFPMDQPAMFWKVTTN